MKANRGISLAIIILSQFNAAYCQEQLDFQGEQDSILTEIRNVKSWYQFGNEKFTLIPMAITALDVTYYKQDANSYEQVGDQDARYEPGQIRAVRFGVVGTIQFKEPWRYVLAGAYRAFDQGFNADSAADFMLYDLRLDIPTKIGTFAFGKTKEPISMQKAASMIYLGGFERGMNLDGMLPSRNTGIIYYNSLYKKRIRFSVGAFKQISVANNVFWKDANTVGVGRLSYNPLVGWLENHDLHVGVGGRYSDFKAGGNLRQHPEAYFASRFVETGQVNGDAIAAINYEIAYRFRNLLLTSEMTRLKIYNEAIGNPVVKGSFIQADYMITGETHSYQTRNATFSPAIPRKNVQQGGPGALELTFRYSTLLTNVSGLEGGDMSRISAFITWYPTLLSKLQVGYGYVTLDRFNLVGYTHIYMVRFAVLIG